jgi:hypothetical protein
VELHFRLFAAFGVVLPAEEFLARSCPHVTARGEEVRILSTEDEAIFLCVHAAAHCYERLIWVHDIRKFLELHPHIDWPVLFTRAAQYGVQVAVAFTMEVLRRSYGAIPAALHHHTRRHRSRWPAAWRLLQQVWKLPSESYRARSAAFLAKLILCDRPSHALKWASHYIGRVSRRRLHRYLSWCVPAEWSA